MSQTPYILILDNDAVSSSTLAQLLNAQGYDSETARTPDEANLLMDRADASVDRTTGVMIVDQDCAGPGGGLDFIQRVRDDRPALVPIVISGFGKIESAVRAMRCGAADYLLKPIVETELLDAIEHAIQRHLLLQHSAPAHESEQTEQPFIQLGPTSTTPSTTAPLNGPAGDWSPMPLAQAMKGPERNILLAALEANQWNRQQTAKQLDINRTTLYKKIRQYRLDEPA